jgi:hypothetical protein
MGMNDIALSALLNYQAERAREPLPQERFAPAISRVLQDVLLMREQAQKARESELRFGAPGRGTAPAVSVGAPPADQRRRLLGIPLGARPPAAAPLPPVGPLGEEEALQLMLNPEASEARAEGAPVFYRPPSRNYQPATVGLDEFKARADVLPYLSADDPAALLTLPDRREAFKGARPRVRAGGTTLLPVTDEMRKRAVETYGYDVLEGVDQIPVSSFNTVLAGSGSAQRQKTREAGQGKRLAAAKTMADLNRLADDLRRKLQDDANYVVRLDDSERAETQDLLNRALQKQVDLLLSDRTGPAKEPPAGGGKTSVPRFASAAQAEAAVQAGKVKKGQKVNIGGKEYVAE